MTAAELDNYLAREVMQWQRIGKEWFGLHGRVVDAEGWRPTQRRKQLEQVLERMGERGIRVSAKPDASCREVCQLACDTLRARGL